VLLSQVADLVLEAFCLGLELESVSLGFLQSLLQGLDLHLLLDSSFDGLLLLLLGLFNVGKEQLRQDLIHCMFGVVSRVFEFLELSLDLFHHSFIDLVGLEEAQVKSDVDPHQVSVLLEQCWGHVVSLGEELLDDSWVEELDLLVSIAFLFLFNALSSDLISYEAIKISLQLLGVPCLQVGASHFV
jgi:hypothetical protein